MTLGSPIDGGNEDARPPLSVAGLSPVLGGATEVGQGRDGSAAAPIPKLLHRGDLSRCRLRVALTTRDDGPSAPAGPGSRGFHPGQECRLNSDFLVSLTQELSSNPLPFVWKIEPYHAC